MSYLEFRNCAVQFDARTRHGMCSFFGTSGKILSSIEELEFSGIPKEYTKCEEIQLPSVKFPVTPELGHWDLSYRFSAPRRKLPVIMLTFRIFAEHIEIVSSGAFLRASGIIRNGDDAERELFAVSDIRSDEVLYCASGPAANTHAAMLYNRQDDSAIACENGTMSLVFNWKCGEYKCDFTIPDGQMLSFKRKEKVCQTLFSLPAWSPLSKKHQFPVPPVGWMSWYSLRFDTNEKRVLENARKMRELFGKFTEKICIWVDWEWCHADLKGTGCDGVDVFHPRRDVYPHGLKFVSEEIKKLDEIPALWCGATVEGRINKFMAAHPESLLADFTLWPGHLWFDLTNPLIAKEYVPEVFRQFLQWGYEVFKWDCWTNTLRIHDEFHNRCFDREKTMESCMHDLISAARRVIGEKRYLLGCTIDERASLGGGRLWDGFRVGGDVFSWQDFCNNGVNNTFRYYPLHNTGLFLDPDTLVLRSEYSDDLQARTRVAFLALTGLQFTLGDPLEALDELRIDALKRAMPVASVHPVELSCKKPQCKLVQTLTAVERPFGSWYISGSFNFDKRLRKGKIRYRSLGLPAGKYAAFDFWKQRFAGISANGIDFPLAPGESAAVRLTPVHDIPALIGTSRHLLQGAVELTTMHWDGAKAVLSGKIRIVSGDPVTLTFYVPERWETVPAQALDCNERIVRLTFSAKQNREISWSIKFRQQQPLE